MIFFWSQLCLLFLVLYLSFLSVAWAGRCSSGVSFVFLCFRLLVSFLSVPWAGWCSWVHFVSLCFCLLVPFQSLAWGSQLCLPLFSSTCLHPVACLGSAIFLGVNFVCLCFPLLVKLSSCLLPVACLGGVMFFGSQLCLPFLPFKLLLPVTCLGGVILFWVHFVSLCFSSSPFRRLLGPGDFFL